MPNMEIEYENEKYYLINDKLTDSHFIELDKNTRNIVAKSYFDQLNIQDLDENDLLDNIKLAKELEQFFFTTSACEYGLRKFFFDLTFVRCCLPIYTSALRMLNMPQKAISFVESYLNNKKYISPSLLTSIAAAYCDIEDYTIAKKFADRAYAMQGGSRGVNELSLVYKRINKHLNFN